jgi:hypothetical protein
MIESPPQHLDYHARKAGADVRGSSKRLVSEYVIALAVMCLIYLAFLRGRGIVGPSQGWDYRFLNSQPIVRVVRRLARAAAWIPAAWVTTRVLIGLLKGSRDYSIHSAITLAVMSWIVAFACAVAFGMLWWRMW